MLRVLTMLVATTVAMGDDAEDIVKKALLASESEAVKPWDAQVQKVIKKANGDVETYYIVTNRGVIGITETSERTVPDGPRPEFKETPDPMDGIYVIVNQRKYRFSGLTPKEAAAALKAQGGSPAFVDRNNVQIAPPSWWQEPTVRIALPPAPMKVPCGMPAPVYPSQLPVFPQINPLSPAARAPVRTAPAVASGFPTIRPTLAPGVGRSSTRSLVGTGTVPTTTSASVAIMAGGTNAVGGTKLPCSA